MTDKDDRQPFFLQLQHDLHQMTYLCFRQCCRRLIHKQDLGILGKCPADCYHLLVCHGDLSDCLIQIHGHTDLVKLLLCDRFDSFPVDYFCIFKFQLADRDIFRNRHMLK